MGRSTDQDQSEALAYLVAVVDEVLSEFEPNEEQTSILKSLHRRMEYFSSFTEDAGETQREPVEKLIDQGLLATDGHWVWITPNGLRALGEPMRAAVEEVCLRYDMIGDPIVSNIMTALRKEMKQTGWSWREFQ